MWQSILLLAVSGAITGMSLRVMEPMLPQLAADFGSSVSAAAIVITGFALAYAVGQLLYGPLGDRFGKLRVVTLSLFCAAAASVSCAFAQDLASLTVLRFVTALFSSSPVTLGMAYIGDCVPMQERQSVIARFVTGTILGQAFGPFVGGLCADLLGWRGAFVLLGAALAAVSSLLYLGTRREWEGSGVAVSGNPYIAFLRLLGAARVRYVMAASFANTFFFFGAYSFLGAFLKWKFDLSLTLIGAILAGVGAGSLLYTLVVKRLLALLGQRGLVAWGGAIGCGGYALVALAPSWMVAIPCSVILGFAFYMLINTLQAKATEMAPEARGSGVSLYTTAWALGQAAGVAIAGIAIGLAGYTPAIVCFGIGYLALGLWLRRNLGRLS